MTRVAFRITGNEADAEEAAQEAFLRAYNKLPSFRQDSAFSTWITRIAMNTAINLVERRNRDLSYQAPRIADEPSPADHTVRVADSQGAPKERFSTAKPPACGRPRWLNLPQWNAQLSLCDIWKISPWQRSQPR